MCRRGAGGVTRMIFRLDTASWAPCFARTSTTSLACRKLCRIVGLPNFLNSDLQVKIAVL
uniref:Uncharacterized protein n=1 Tax=Solanum tuberosum TaxID=4113 RepID=M1B000_SOLTU